ncbi:transposable element Tc1 transposase [Trichonephila clavipes]|uniref:Transposable element Tc1 transposase n=1 Tax=Trichonephila clavipes TaxID=2585209 RepID=A0A8X6WIQ6_TRICX|nr:transposable element Tc1 transposase [Trichonephila clavipes]
MPRRRIRAHYEQLSEFKRGRINGLKEKGWVNRRIARHMGRSWDQADRGRIVFSDESRFHLCPDDHQRRSGEGQGTFKTLPWPSRSPDPSPIEHVWDMMGSRLHLPGNVDDLPRELVQIWQEIPQETIRVLYHSMSRRVAAAI